MRSCSFQIKFEGERNDANMLQDFQAAEDTARTPGSGEQQSVGKFLITRIFD